MEEIENKIQEIGIIKENNVLMKQLNRCGLLDYVDSLDISYPTEWDDELSDLLEELEEMIDEDIEILESELEELDNTEDALDEITFYKNQIEYLEGVRNEYC